MVFTQMSAQALSQAIHRRQVSCREVMQACLKQIERHNPTFNAIINLQDPDGLLQQADACDAQLARGHSMGWMHGLPIADRKSTRLNSSHMSESRMPSSA